MYSNFLYSSFTDKGKKKKKMKKNREKVLTALASYVFGWDMAVGGGDCRPILGAPSLFRSHFAGLCVGTFLCSTPSVES